jgi:hypothetical protein
VSKRADRRAVDERAHRVSRLRPELYDVYRLLSLYGPADDREIQDRAHNHGVQAGPRQLLQRRRALEEAGLVFMEGDGRWHPTPPTLA